MSLIITKQTSLISRMTFNAAVKTGGVWDNCSETISQKA
jgi:hypothetical protein